MIRLFEMKDYVGSDQLREEYGSSENPAGSCSECGVCIERCPFDVDVITRLREITSISVTKGARDLQAKTERLPSNSCSGS
jgi:heterodisulfide reductase subunit C